MEAGANEAIRVRGLGRDYGDRPALTGLDLELGFGRTLLLIGPNGSGKSTLLRVLAGLLRPTEGEVEVLGATLPSESWKIRGRVGYLGHRPLLYRDLTGRENLELQAELNGIPGDLARDRIEADLELVGMSVRANDRVADYSAGMAQRIAICRAVITRPELLLLDEPDSNLDPSGREVARELIGPAEGRTRVLVSHQPEQARAEADQILQLTGEGRVEAIGGTA
jgi:heme exporter protein A